MRARDRTVEHQLKQLLEELRVALPGLQLMFGFLLIAPFNQRFERVSRPGLALFATAIASTFLASVLLIAPSVYHRVYGPRALTDKERLLVRFGKFALVGSAFLCLALVSGMSFIADFLLGHVGATLIGLGSAAVCAGAWYGLPIVQRARDRGFGLGPAEHEQQVARSAAHLQSPTTP